MLDLVRKPVLANLVYSAEKGALEHFLNYTIRPHIYDDSIVGIVSPHIDYQRGMEVYAAVYGALHASRFDRLLILGTSHYFGQRYFVMTRHSYETPLGILRNDLEFIDYVAGKYGVKRAFDEESRHVSEHSIELQVPFLQVRGFKNGAVPLLVGSFHDMLLQGVYPEEVAEYDEFMSALCEGICTLGGRTGVVLGVDLAHIGEQFGDMFRVDSEVGAILRVLDDELLQLVCRHDKRGFFDNIASDCDRRRVCGFAPIYVYLDLLDRLSISGIGEVLRYHQAIDEGGRCCVSIASMILRVK
jgi:hypothetical protein